jgi:hypothetical protein
LNMVPVLLAPQIKSIGGAFIINNILIESKDSFQRECLCAPFELEFPNIHGMVFPFTYKLEAKKIANVALIDVKLSGGATNHEIVCDEGWYTPNEELLKPYIRIEAKDGNSSKFYMVNGTVGLREASEMGLLFSQVPNSREQVSIEFDCLAQSQN